MFRVVVGVGIVLLPVFIASVAAGPAWAGLVLLFELGILFGVWWSRRRAAKPGDDPG